MCALVEYKTHSSLQSEPASVCTIAIKQRSIARLYDDWQRTLFSPTGVFQHGHMHFSGFRHKDVAGEPSLAEMTEKAIRILRKNNNGYFLLVEGKERCCVLKIKSLVFRRNVSFTLC